ncbi:putative arginine n-methyltransferase [Phaeomoniella chlamydospora]|uniref:Arginine N-methyltransferase 2 n=1 Tax=Phaeomoniella chlamydospora TaxID=158046 RepID=A0A0G2EU12_PHACM|nr:putative arginine n-methyltransferase [Phaeomoniella chlamydospora]
MAPNESSPVSDDQGFAVDLDTRVQEILLAASNHDVTTLEQLFRDYEFSDCHAADVRDTDTGFTPLHAAIAACDVSEGEEGNGGNHIAQAASNETDPPVLSETNGLSPQEDLVQGARETIQCLLRNGAIWNQLDTNNDTPGCIALRLGLKELYALMVDAGVRAEMLLNRLEKYEQLDDDEEEEEEDTEKQGTTNGHSSETEAEVVVEDNGDVPSEQYLASALTHTGDKLLDERNNGVMMAWESDIMRRSADALLTQPDLRVLNIGFGMGIIDGHIQDSQNRPAEHHIIEAHHSVLADMQTKGWFDKPNVTIHQGKWQEVLPNLVAQNQVFDAIYFDTFAENYSQFYNFFSEQVIGLLDPSGRWSFFNGMGADRQISYDVYQKVAEMDLFEAGFDVEWNDMEVPTLDEEWEGVKRKYWNVDRYRLPVCKFMD